MRLPSKRDYPDYYDIITRPIDMTTIEYKIKNDRVSVCWVFVVVVQVVIVSVVLCFVSIIVVCVVVAHFPLAQLPTVPRDAVVGG